MLGAVCALALLHLVGFELVTCPGGDTRIRLLGGGATNCPLSRILAKSDMIAVALEMYRDEKGHYPRSLSELYEAGFLDQGWREYVPERWSLKYKLLEDNYIMKCQSKVNGYRVHYYGKGWVRIYVPDDGWKQYCPEKTKWRWKIWDIIVWHITGGPDTCGRRRPDM